MEWIIEIRNKKKIRIAFIDLNNNFRLGFGWSVLWLSDRELLISHAVFELVESHTRNHKLPKIQMQIVKSRMNEFSGQFSFTRIFVYIFLVVLVSSVFVTVSTHDADDRMHQIRIEFNESTNFDKMHDNNWRDIFK